MTIALIHALIMNVCIKNENRVNARINNVCVHKWDYKQCRWVHKLRQEFLVPWYQEYQEYHQEYQEYQQNIKSTY